MYSTSVIENILDFVYRDVFSRLTIPVFPRSERTKTNAQSFNMAQLLSFSIRLQTLLWTVIKEDSNKIAVSLEISFICSGYNRKGARR